MEITISEGLGWLKTLNERHRELVSLRDQNSSRETRFYGANVDKTKIIEPVYNVKNLDHLVSRLAREIRLLDEAIKRTNSTIHISGYDKDDAVLGELDMATENDRAETPQPR